MKPAITFLLFLFIHTFLSAQAIKEANVPFKVMDRFTLLYPDAKSLLWEMKSEKFIARFKNDRMDTKAILAEDGTVIRTETEINIIALPVETTAYLKTNFESKKVEAARIAEDEKGVITFMALIEDVDYTFDSNGQLIATDHIAVGNR